jgi:TonB family protein
MRLIVIAFALAGCAAAAWAQDPAAPAPTPSTARAHDMSQICADNDRQRHYPERALVERVGGEVVLDCSVNADYTLGQCQIVEETPRRYGFGDSALRLACLWRLSDTTTGYYEGNGERRIRKPVRFRLN